MPLKLAFGWQVISYQVSNNQIYGNDRYRETEPDRVETPIAFARCSRRLEFCKYWLVERIFDLNCPVGAVWAGFGFLWLALAEIWSEHASSPNSRHQSFYPNKIERPADVVD